MFIVWGKRKAAKHRGYTAEFCPICRSIQPLRVKDIEMVSHLYFIPFGRGNCVGQKCTCMGCGRTVFVEPFTYRSFVHRRDTDISRLVHETRPGLLNELTHRLMLEERLRGVGQPLTSDERMQLIAEAFYVMSDPFDQRLKRGGALEPLTGLSLFATVGLLVAFMILVAGNKLRTATALGALSGVSLVGTVYAIATQARRIAKRHIVPRLVKALAPLQPTRAELDDVVEHLRDRGLRIGRKLKPEWVLEAIRTTQTPRGLHQAASSTTGARLSG